jgi:hypothetical protein
LDGRRGAKRYASRDEIDPLDFGCAVGRVSLVDVLEGPRRFRYRLVSTSLTARLGYEMTGKFLDEIQARDAWRRAGRTSTRPSCRRTFRASSCSMCSTPAAISATGSSALPSFKEWAATARVDA